MPLSVWLSAGCTPSLDREGGWDVSLTHLVDAAWGHESSPWNFHREAAPKHLPLSLHVSLSHVTINLMIPNWT